jgi:carbamoyl-phosphate synthase small subunit
MPENMNDNMLRNAALVFSDGGVFFGYGIGKQGRTSGEICFNTAMTGYQEIITDPSYSGQIITFTFPHIGNVGINKEDVESAKAQAKGVILRTRITEDSNYRAEQNFNQWLKQNNITGICGVDTRAITHYVRTKGASNVAIIYQDNLDILPLAELHKMAKDTPSMEGMELAEAASTPKPYKWDQNLWKWGKGYGTVAEAVYRVVVIDYGVKYNILRCLAEVGCDLTIVPAKTSAREILDLKPDGVMLSNGPGDPAATGQYSVPVIRELIEKKIPVFGICLGHQMLGISLGCKTEKMKQGHRGANHPVKYLPNNRVEITSQNHGFVVVTDGDKVVTRHRSLFDGSVEGIILRDMPVFSVQHHPEASPGPHDSFYLFQNFIRIMAENKRG